MEDDAFYCNLDIDAIVANYYQEQQVQSQQQQPLHQVVHAQQHRQLILHAQGQGWLQQQQQQQRSGTSLQFLQQYQQRRIPHTKCLQQRQELQRQQCSQQSQQQSQQQQDHKRMLAASQQQPAKRQATLQMPKISIEQAHAKMAEAAAKRPQVLRLPAGVTVEHVKSLVAERRFVRTMKEQRLLMAAPVDVQWRLIEPLVNAQGVKWITPETDRSDVTIAAHAAGADNLFHRPTCVLTIKNFTCRDIMPVSKYALFNKKSYAAPAPDPEKGKYTPYECVISIDDVQLSLRTKASTVSRISSAYAGVGEVALRLGSKTTNFIWRNGLVISPGYNHPRDDMDVLEAFIYGRGRQGRFPGTTNGGGFESAELALFFQLTPDASRPCYSVGVEVISLAR